MERPFFAWMYPSVHRVFVKPMGRSALWALIRNPEFCFAIPAKALDHPGAFKDFIKFIMVLGPNPGSL